MCCRWTFRAIKLNDYIGDVFVQDSLSSMARERKHSLEAKTPNLWDWVSSFRSVQSLLLFIIPPWMIVSLSTNRTLIIGGWAT